MTREIVFRYVVNIRLITCRSDLGPFSPPQRLSLILNVGSVVSPLSQGFVEMPSPHFSAAHNPTRTKKPHYIHHKDGVFSLVTALVLSKLRQDETDRYVFSMVAI
jgi:hypothetical protein